MNELQKYAHLKRSGLYRGAIEGKSPELDRPPTSVLAPPADYLHPGKHHTWAVWVICAVLFLILLWMVFLHPRSPYRIDQKAVSVLEELYDDPRPYIYAWANKMGIGLDCRGMTVKNESQVILHNCRINTRLERESRQEIKKL